jgi:predicted outer membrane repeat protein
MNNIHFHKQPMTRSVLRGLMLVVLLAGLGWTVPQAGHVHAADYSAGSTAELIAAINNAYDNPGPDTITLTADITLDADLPEVLSEIAIEGGGYFISGDHTRIVFIVGEDYSQIGNLTLHQVVITHGQNPWTFGGALWVKPYSTLTLLNCTITSNTGFEGGAIYTQGALVVTDSTFSGNNSTSFSGGAISGGVSVTITRSTFTGNSAAGSGGAILIRAGAVTITDSTLSGNSAYWGGGINIKGGSLSVVSSTIANNTVTAGGSAILQEGGSVQLAGTLLGKASSGTTCSGVIGDAGYNLSDDDSCAFNAPGSANNAVLSLAPLADNDGPTWTQALQAGSEALDRIPLDTTALGANLCPSTGGADQRGYPRPNPPGAPCDAGSFESSLEFTFFYYLPAIARHE